MPSGPALSPGTVPGRFTGLLGLPQGKVHGIAFLFIGVHPGPGLQLLKVLPGELPIVVKGRGVIPYIPIYLIGQSLFYEIFYKGYHFVYMLRSPGVDGGPLYSKAVGVFKVFLNKSLCQLCYSDFLFICPLDHLVVNIGEVLDIGYLVTLVLHISPEDVKDDKGAGIAYVKIVVHRRSTAIHPYLVFVYWYKVLFLSG